MSCNIGRWQLKALLNWISCYVVDTPRSQCTAGVPFRSANKSKRKLRFGLRETLFGGAGDAQAVPVKRVRKQIPPELLVYGVGQSVNNMSEIDSPRISTALLSLIDNIIPFDGREDETVVDDQRIRALELAKSILRRV
jgi:hypothetical protein